MTTISILNKQTLRDHTAGIIHFQDDDTFRLYFVKQGHICLKSGTTRSAATAEAWLADWTRSLDEGPVLLATKI